MKSTLFALGCLLASSTALAGERQLTTEDGAQVTIHEDGEGSRAVVLIHGKGGSANDLSLIHI